MTTSPVSDDRRFPDCCAAYAHPLSDAKTLKVRIEELLRENTNEGYSKLLDAYYCYVQPSRSKYPFQWFWDSCFHVFMLCSIGELQLAKRNLWSLFAMQEPNGFVGHMIFWKRVFPTTPSDVLQSRPTFGQMRPHMSALIQPSFAAQALLRIADESKDTEYVQVMLPKIKRYLEWVMQNRDFDGDHLITIISPVESGMDFKPSYDEVLGYKGEGEPDRGLFLKAVRSDMRNFRNRYDLKRVKKARGFLVKDVTVNTAFALDLAAVAEICERIGDPDAQKWRDASAKVTHAIRTLMYDEKDAAFYDLRGPDNHKLRVKTPTIFFPMILPGIPDEMCGKIVERHLHHSSAFAAPFPLPSCAMDERQFYAKDTWYLWRGPTWIFNNWFLHRAFLERGFTEEADALLKTCHALIDIGGLREYYDPLTGEGEGEEHFTWSGLVMDMMWRANKNSTSHKV
ncbi:MAG TPA: hypothetical protein VHA78_05895 [Candidatus Peribacteraceae bacterium]|nr:hypothetical protein [Candidatus Peribacteraceae bacterium]